MAIIGVLKRNTCHIEECNANPYKSTRWQDQQLENIAKDKGKTEADGLGWHMAVALRRKIEAKTIRVLNFG